MDTFLYLWPTRVHSFSTEVINSLGVIIYIVVVVTLESFFFGGCFFPGAGPIFPNERNSKYISKGMMSNLVCCNDMPSLEITVWILALLCEGRAWAEQSTLSSEY